MTFDQKQFSKDVLRARSSANAARKLKMTTTTGIVSLLVPGGLRSAARNAKVSAPTLSRIERGRSPDIHTFAKLCAWMDVNPAKYFKP